MPELDFEGIKNLVALDIEKRLPHKSLFSGEVDFLNSKTEHMIFLERQLHCTKNMMFNDFIKRCPNAKINPPKLSEG